MKNKELQNIINKIEELRLQLYKLAEKKGVIDQEVIITSQMLDSVLNKYYYYFK